MPALPYFDNVDLQESKKYVIIFSAYFTALAFLGLFIFDCYNFNKFLLKTQPKRKLSDPLLMFYLVGLCAIFSRMLTCIFLVRIYMTYAIILRYLPGLFKLNVGLI